MGWGLHGVTVTVVGPDCGPPDPFGARTRGEPPETSVGDVLVDRPSTADVEETTRAYGVTCDLTLHFPKSFAGSLRGCRVVLPPPWDGAYEVVGDPQPYDPSLTPGAHNRPVRVRRVSG